MKAPELVTGDPATDSPVADGRVGEIVTGAAERAIRGRERVSAAA